MISMGAVAVGTMALVIVLSVFNGLEDLIRSLHNFFDPELKISATAGKSFELRQSFIDSVAAVPGVQVVTQVVEDNAYLKYRDSEMVVIVQYMICPLPAILRESSDVRSGLISSQVSPLSLLRRSICPPV